MDATEQIRRFGEFIETHYYSDVLEAIRTGRNFLVTDFAILSKFDTELAEDLLREPEETIKAAELAVAGFEANIHNFKVRFSNLPLSQKLAIRDIRSKHLKQFYTFDGVVRQKTDVKPQVTSAKFECPSCGSVISILQLDTRFREPSKCNCGRKGKFHLVGKDLIDVQVLTIEESADNLDGGAQPKRMKIFLKEDLVSPMSEKRTNPGTRIIVNGVVNEVPVVLRTGGQSTRYDLLITANYLQAMHEDFTELEISEEDEKEIKALGEDPQIYERLLQSIVPAIYGHERIKEALIYQLLGGVRKARSDGSVTRGDIHILLIGDPGGGKSQMLKRISTIAPKSRYVSGKGVSGAGLTAAVVKDDLLGGWSLEAGALVLANHGIVCIDELDKMTKEDRDAMHEALEQQCYHPLTKITLADGSRIEIGEFVDQLMHANKKGVRKGCNCEILELKNPVKILATDFKSIFPCRIKNLSRHAAPARLVKIVLANGKEVTVTPEHPCWAFNGSSMTTIAAEKLKAGDYFPIPSGLPFQISVKKQGQEKLLCKILGYHITDGCYELNRGVKNGIQFCNNNYQLIKDYSSAVKLFFNKSPSLTKRGKLYSARVISKEIVNYFLQLDPNLMEKGKYKTIPEKAMRFANSDISYLLRALFDGDGTVVNVKRNGCRVTLITENRELADQVTELLLRFGILSSIYVDREFFKVDVSGHDNLLRFSESIGFLSEKKQARLEKYLGQKKTYRSISDIVPNSSESIRRIIRQLGVNAERELGNQVCMGCEKHRVSLQRMLSLCQARIEALRKCRRDAIGAKNSAQLARIRQGARVSRMRMSALLGISMHRLKMAECKGDIITHYAGMLIKEIDSKLACVPEYEALADIACGETRWSRIKSVEYVGNGGIKRVYDITVEPTHAFISNNMILHNSVSISKASIQATLRTETTVLAAANPKHGRFNPYDIVSSQIDLPPTLINRFDLIFPIKDVPDRERDEIMAKFVLTLHKDQDIKEPEISSKLLRKYFAYARQRIKPVLTDSAVDAIKDYYVKMRGQGSEEEGGNRSVPISARQLEALVRLAEASAKMRLSSKVTRKDAQRAIDILHHCLTLVGYDPETKKFDIDRISTGISASTRSNIFTIKDIINELEGKLGKTIPLNDIIMAAKEKGIESDKAEETIEKLKRSGDLYEPKRGFISKV